MWNSTRLLSESVSPYVPLHFQQNETRILLNEQDLTDETDETPVVDFTYAGSRQVASFRAIQLPVVSMQEFGLESASPGTTTMPPAKCWTCAIEWYEKSYTNLRVTGSNPPTYTASTESLGFVSVNGSAMHYGLYHSGVNSLKGDVWKFRYGVHDRMSNYLSRFFESKYYVDANYGLNDIGSEQADLNSNPGAILGIVLSKDLNATISRVSDSLTETIRTGRGATTVRGQTLVTKSFIRVR